MGERIGLIAGAGNFPLLALAEAKKQGLACVVAGLRGLARPELEERADAFSWFEPAELGRLAVFLKGRDVHRVLLAGKIDPGTIFKIEFTDEEPRALLARVPDKTPTSLIRALIDYLAGQGLAVIDPAPWLSPYFCPAGVLTATPPSAAVLEDIEFGWSKARRLADEDIGQTLVVKDRAIVAVEGLEGTDETIKRAGRLAGAGIVVLKVARTGQDMRIDVPAVGAETMRSLIRVAAAALCFEAGRLPFFDRTEAVALAEANRIVVLARTS